MQVLEALRSLRRALALRCVAVRWKTIPYDAGNRQSREAACRELAGVIGPHIVAQLTFADHTWNSPDVGVVFESAPPLRYAECVDLLSPTSSTIRRGDSDVFMSQLAGGMKELRLRVDYEVFCQFDWAFLRRGPDADPARWSQDQLSPDLVCRAQKPLVDVYACDGCGKQAAVADLFTCDTCQETFNTKPLWFCGVCAMKQHRGHTTSECNKATQQQIQEACQGIASSGSLADVYIGLTMSHLNGALEKTELISQLLNQQKRGFSLLQERVKSADQNLTQEDLAASLQEANDLKQKFEQASTFANEAGKGLESVLLVCRKKVEQLFLKELDEEPIEMEESDMSDEEPVEAEDSGMSHNSFDLSRFPNDQKAIELNECRVDAIPDLSSFTKLELLKGTGRELTFRMSTLRSNELVLDESDYAIDVVDTTPRTTRYTSDESGIVVEVNGRWVTIQSTAEVPRKKRRTSGEVLPSVEQ